MQVLATSFPEAGTKTSLLAEMEEGSRFSIFKKTFSMMFSTSHLLLEPILYKTGFTYLFPRLHAT